MLSKDISDETGQGFSATFSGREFFLADVSLQRKKLMPGELLLEMARVAAVLTVKETEAVRLTHIVWSKPILTEAEPFHIEIRLISAEGEAKRFEIYNPFSADYSHHDVYSQGTIQPVDARAWHAGYQPLEGKQRLPDGSAANCSHHSERYRSIQ
nr:polyketide synthase dehydratase domain-containing protein [Bacillus velezensis]